EQRSGAPVTTATDVYALGVLCGELMTGRRPGDTARRGLRGDLDTVVSKAIDPDPERRYVSAGALADDVERLLDGRPLLAHPPSRWYRLRKFVRRHRVGTGATIAFLVVLVVALGVAVWQAQAARREARLAREQAQHAAAVRAFLFGIFNQADPDQNKS